MTDDETQPTGSGAAPVSASPDPATTTPPYASLHEYVTGTIDLRLPDFAQIDADALLAECDLVEQLQAAALQSIKDTDDTPTFRNTTVAIDDAQAPACRLSAVTSVLASNLLTDALQPAVATLRTRLQVLFTDVVLDADLYERLAQVPTANLNPEDRRHHELMVEDFLHAGAKLSPEDRDRVAQLIAEITRLEIEFQQELLAESDSLALHCTTADELDGLSSQALDNAQALARSRELDGYVVPLVNTTQQPSLENLRNPATRARLLENSMSRGARGGAHDTRTIIADVTALRAALAGELGYQSYADYSISQQAAGSPDAASALLTSTLPAALDQAREELATLAAEAAAGESTTTGQATSADQATTAGSPSGGGPTQELAASDVTYHLHKHAESAFDLDTESLSQYFEFSRVLVDGAFYTATQLYGVTFEPTDLHAWHPDATVYRALENDTVLGLICVDPYARPEKSGGAWMDELRAPGRYTGERPIITLSTNFPKPQPGTPLLLSVDNVITVFHEFGHVLHALFSDSTYPTRSGTSVPRDFVEFPSQLNEMWAFHPWVLPNYAVHCETGQTIPQELVDTVLASQKFGQGVDTVEYLAAALLDLGWHSLEAGEQVEAVLTFESQILEATGFDPVIPPRYRSTYFSHIFSNGYSAGYYSYLWSEVLAAYTAEWFLDQGGLNPEAGEAFRRQILAPGYSVNLTNAIQDFFGETPGVAPLMRRRGLAPEREPHGSEDETRVNPVVADTTADSTDNPGTTSAADTADTAEAVDTTDSTGARESDSAPTAETEA